MASALISLCVTALVVAAKAEPDGSGGFSLGGGQSSYATPGSQGVRYAGPIVYTNEKPPVIHFPPPPTHGKGGFGGSGSFGKSNSIKYIPLPHHDLPVLIYQSDISPPIHVVHPNQGKVTPTKSQKNEFGSQKTEYTSSAPKFSYSSAPSKTITYDHISTDYSTQSKTVYKPAQRLPKQQQNYYNHPPKSYNYGSMEYTSHYQPKNQYRVSKPYRPSAHSDLYSSGTAPVAQVSDYKSSNPYQEKSKKSSPLPHIIYAGHPPIHIFQQPPIYMAAPKGPSYSTSKSPSSDYFYTSESSPPRTYVQKSQSQTFSSTAPKPSYSYSSNSSPKQTQTYSSSSGEQQTKSYTSGPKQSQTHTYSSGPKPTYSSASIPTFSSSPKPKSNSSPIPVFSSSPKPKYNSASIPIFSSSPKPKYNSAPMPVYSSSPKPTYSSAPRPTFSSAPKPTFSSSSKPTTYSSEPKPKNEYRPSSNSQDYNRPQSSKGLFGRQQGDYSSPPAVYAKPQSEYTFSSLSYRPPKNDYYHSPKSWASSLSGGGGGYQPIKYKKSKSKQVTYSPAPKSWHKPPIIIYQGVKPPVHMFENVVSFESVHGPGVGVPSNYATRRISSPGVAAIDPRANIEYSNVGTGSGFVNPTMWIPAYGLQTQNGYQTTLYVSDLTSAGSTQQFVSPVTPIAVSTANPAESVRAKVEADKSVAETSAVAGQTSDGPGETTITTSQVTNSATQAQADEVKGMTPPMLTIRILH